MRAWLTHDLLRVAHCASRLGILLPILALLASPLPIESQSSKSLKVELTGSPEPVYAQDSNDAWNRIFHFLFSRRMEVRLSDEFPEGAPFT